MEKYQGLSLVEILISLIILSCSSLVLFKHQYELINRQRLVERQAQYIGIRSNQFELDIARFILKKKGSHHAQKPSDHMQPFPAPCS